MSLGKNIAKQMYGLVENNEEALQAALAALEAEKTELSAEEVEEGSNAIEAPEKAEFGSAAIAGEGEELIYFPGDDITEGTPVFSDENMENPLADGSYELESGLTIEVSEGAINSISEPGAEDEEEAPSEEEDMAGEAVTLEAIAAEFAPIFQALDERITALEAENGQKEEEMEAVKEELEAEKAKVEKLSKASSTNHVSNAETRMPQEVKGNTFQRFTAKYGK